MRISYFAPRCIPDSGHGRYVIELAKRLGQTHSVTVYSGAFWPPLASYAEWHRLPVPDRPAIARLSILWATSLIGSSSRRADILHSQGADAPVGNVVTAHFCNRTMRAIAGSELGWIRRFNYSLGEAAEKYCMCKRSTRSVIAVSRGVKLEIEREYGVDSAKVQVIHHGVDLEAFHPGLRGELRTQARRGLNLREDHFVILFVGGDYRRKGLVALLRALSSLPERTRVVVLEVRPDQALSALLKESKLAGRVSFVPRTSEIAPLYAAADCFALPTQYDTFSLTTLEAMAMGLPVVISGKAGVTELLSPGHDCLILEDPNDTEGLTRLLARLARDADLRAQLSAAGRKTAEQHSWDHVAARTLDVYQQVLGTSQG